MADYFFTTSPESTFHTQFSKYTRIPGSLDLLYVKPSMTAAQNNHLLPILGDAFMAELLTAVAGTPSASEAALIEKVREALAPLTTIELLPALNVKMGQGGITQNNNQNEQPAEFWQTRDLKRRLEDNANRAVSRLIQYLATNSSDFATYEDSAAHQRSQRNFCNDFETANIIAPLLKSYYVFQEIRPAMTRADEMLLRPLLTDPLFDHLKALSLAGDSWGVYEPLREAVQRVEIHTALSNSIEEAAVKYSAEFGIHIALLAEVESGRRATEVDERRRESVVRGHRNYADYAVNELKRILKKTPQTFPLYTPPTLPNKTIIEPGTNASIYPAFGLGSN